MLKKYLYTALLAVLLVFTGTGNVFAAEIEPLIPNDTFYNRQWAMDYINAPQAWAMIQKQHSTPTRDIVVAIVDGGVDFNHPDLKGALWDNPDEIFDGQDNDRDGLVDDMHGWNFAADNNDIKPMGNKVIDTGAWEHGTIVASLIAARGNDDIGIAGVAWNVKIMPLVILSADGYGGTDLLARAIRYAVDHRADIINLSLEGHEEDEAVAQAIKDATARGVLVVIAAGNGEDGQGYDLDATPLYPSCHEGAADQGVLVVASLDEGGTRHATSNYGSCVSLAAPGNAIFAARPIYDGDGNKINVPGYGAWSGTSLAAPLVSGVAALVKAQHPFWTGEQIAQKIKDTAQPFGAEMDSHGLGAGALDAAAALNDAGNDLYGPWQLLASTPGQEPRIWVVNSKGGELFSFPVGDQSDKRGVRAVFVRWDEDRLPEVMVTSEGDESGSWRIYRRDGVLLAAGDVFLGQPDKAKGGLLLSVQDVDADGWDDILMTEANGPRIWQLKLDGSLEGPMSVGEEDVSLGNIAVGIQNPIQAFTLLSREKLVSKLYILNGYGLSESQDVNTGNPSGLQIAQGRSDDNREVVQLVQSGKPTYMVDRMGLLDVVNYPVNVVQWRQAPQGMLNKILANTAFYDVWPR